eukprot:CAMPEP_0206486486 /NCGR_PEP_ID=MMETSP0324_2-20121206/41074_1 /ASSEMBLY_ACC=CAM_ASM_000836 /TAXON_ID=2866 /ORGANISM="Crypthecodinium cohnii, Strain Seligo" /LENGTH=158 /DNA_ID=CAMNT_0053964785 /DNA_START=208 /DNA_END=684 /DNA_ORIENTATION=+
MVGWLAPQQLLAGALLRLQHRTRAQNVREPSHLLAFTMSGPTLSPVSLLCVAWEPSQYGNFLDRQQRHITTFPSVFCSSSMSPTTSVVTHLSQPFSMSGLIVRGLFRRYTNPATVARLAPKATTLGSIGHFLQDWQEDEDMVPTGLDAIGPVGATVAW